MMNHKLIILFAIAGMLISCDNEEPFDVRFIVNVKSHTFTADGGSKNFNLASNVSWRAVSNQDWLLVSPENGDGESTITLTVRPNDTPDERKGIVSMIPDEGDVVEVTVTQEAFTFSVDITEFSLGEESQKIVLNLKSNISWNATVSADWLSIEPDKGDENTEITLKIDRNSLMQERSAILKIEPMAGKAIEITVRQDAASNVSSLIRYVTAEAVGSRSGHSQDDAADFLDKSFWAGINEELKTKSVEVLFLPGDYRRALTDTNVEGFALDRMGDENNRLTLSGGNDVVFMAPEGYNTKTNLIRFHGSQNITFRDFNFTGDGSVNYVLAIRTPDGFPPSRNILVENCTWLDMRGTIIGGTGCHYVGTTNVTYRNCTFKRIGREDRATHIMYHAYGPTHISVIDCHFEDGMGEYVRFRAHTDYGMVKNCTFNRTSGWDAVPYIAMPNYNNQDPGDEYFGTNYSFTGNVFKNNSTAITFRHTGFTPKEYNYLLTAQEGAIMESGSKEDRATLLKNNFGIDVDKIRITDNDYQTIYDMKVSFRSSVLYGAVSLGWVGTVDISDMFDDDGSKQPFGWEIY